MNETCKRGLFCTSSCACHHLIGICVLDPCCPGKEVKQLRLEALLELVDLSLQPSVPDAAPIAQQRRPAHVQQGRVKPYSANNIRILGAEGGKIGGNVLASTSPLPLVFPPHWTLHSLGAFPSIVV